jgi:two-component system, NarL family, response regulator DevR
MAEVLRVMLVDDQDVIRSGVRTILEAGGDIQVVCEADSTATAVRGAQEHRPGVAVMDVQLASGDSGIAATREIRRRHPEVRVLMLTAFPDEAALIESVRAGASGYLLKQLSKEELVAAVRSVGQGQHVIDKAVTGLLLERVRNAPDPDPPTADRRLDALTPQELRILSLVAEGLGNRPISTALGISEKTARNYVSSILGKLGVSNRTEAAAYLARREH